MFDTKFNMCIKNIKNMQFNDQIFKIYSHVNFFSKSCSFRLQSKTIHIVNLQLSKKKYFEVHNYNFHLKLVRMVNLVKVVVMGPVNIAHDPLTDNIPRDGAWVLSIDLTK